MKKIGRPFGTCIPAIERFSTKYIPEPNSGCWIWTGMMRKDGYGYFYFNRRPTLAHRASWVIHNGEFSDDLFVCHKCDMRYCVNPDHLFLGTHFANMADMVSKKRSRAGEKNHNAKLTAKQVRAIRESPARALDIAKELGVSASIISDVRTGHSWRGF